MWIDRELTWDPGNTGVKSLRVPAGIVWLPDLAFNGVFVSEYQFVFPNIYRLEQKYIPDRDETIVSIQRDGRVHGSFNLIVTLHCNYDIGDFPFDVQVMLL